MKAIVVRETGGPEVLRLEEIERPRPGDGELLIRVRAASVNPIDWKRRRGIAQTQLPAVPGIDVSGVVELSNVDWLAEGDEVFGAAASGSYAEYAVAAADKVVRKPAGLSHEQAAAIPVCGLTAWQALFELGDLDAGQAALIAGGAGGVGHFAVQFAHQAGARTIATASARNRDFVLGLGADEFVDYAAQDVGEVVTDVDVALDTVGGATTASLVPTLREGGILVTIANAPPEDAARERGARAVLSVTNAPAEDLARIGAMVAAGEIRVELSEVIPLSEARRAHELGETGHVRGKIVLAVG